MFVPKGFITYTTLTVTVKVDRKKIDTLEKEGPVSNSLAIIVNRFEKELQDVGFRPIIEES